MAKEVTNDTIDPATQAIDKEDALFERNTDILFLNGEIINLELLKKFKMSELLGRKTLIVEKHWKLICDCETILVYKMLWPITLLDT